MEPASIRFKNPGAMWGNAIAIKWGASKQPVVLHDGKGQGNNIAVFPTFVQGICAQMDLWRTSKNYRNKSFAEAIWIWSGHNETPSYIAFCKRRVPGLNETTVMDEAFWKGPMAIPFLKAQAWHEAGKPYPATDEEWMAAYKRVMSGVPTKNTMKKAVVVATTAGAPTVAAAASSSSNTMLLINIAIGAVVAIGAFVAWKYWHKVSTRPEEEIPHPALVAQQQGGQ